MDSDYIYNSMTDSLISHCPLTFGCTEGLTFAKAVSKCRLQTMTGVSSAAVMASFSAVTAASRTSAARSAPLHYSVIHVESQCYKQKWIS